MGCGAAQGNLQTTKPNSNQANHLSSSPLRKKDGPTVPSPLKTKSPKKSTKSKGHSASESPVNLRNMRGATKSQSKIEGQAVQGSQSGTNLRYSQQDLAIN